MCRLPNGNAMPSEKLAKLSKSKASSAAACARLTGARLPDLFGAKPGARISSAYMDYANRLPRGRTYVRNGSVVDLQIAKGEITALREHAQQSPHLRPGSAHA